MAIKKSGRRKGAGPFAGVPHRVIDSENYALLGAWEVKLLLEFARQYNGKNNVDFSATFSQKRKMGWASPGTLNKAIKNLVRYGFIVKTRQGGKNQCCLYALTWVAIDDCKGKLDVSPTITPLNLWMEVVEN